MFIDVPLFSTAVLIAAVLIDYVFGEPGRWHPLIAFAAVATFLENKIYADDGEPWESKLRGVIAVLAILLLIVTPLLVFEVWFNGSDFIGFIIGSIVVYFCIAPRSLREHARAVEQPLLNNNLLVAREKLSFIVSRDVDSLSEQEIAAATCESVLENGSDAIFSAMFWFLVAGIPGVVVYRISNTLDAMWGYRNERYQDFGWAAAKLDDVLNWLPARIVALSYAVLGNYTVAIRCWREQASAWKSPNAGPVMSAGAGSLEIRLGGRAQYHGNEQSRPVLGVDNPVEVHDIARALKLVDRTLILWLLVITVISFVLVT